MEEECSIEPKQNTVEGETKRVRRRRKKIYQVILQQMEFYFSDANLCKDRFLYKLTQDDPYVDLSVFLKFNKIRALTDNVEDIANALSKSQLLTLSSDRTKVCRETPVRPNYNEDECSIYVENLPPDAKHEWLKDIFTVYGKVAYVSIPKYRQSGKIKGFAFVEFESPETANRALEAFGAAGCCLPSDMAPEQLCSVTTFEPGEGKNQVGLAEDLRKGQEEDEQFVEECGDIKEEVTVEGNESKDVIEEGESNTEICPPGESVSKEKKRRKRRRDESDGEEEKSETDEGERKPESCVAEECSSPLSKKKKMKKDDDGDEEQLERGGDEENTEVCPADSSPLSKEKKKKKRKKEGSDDEEEQQLEEEKKKVRLEVESENEKENTEEQKERKKKRKKRNKNKKEKLEEEAVGLHILSKREWKRLRNKYLNLQRKNMKNLRIQMMGGRWGNYWGEDGGDGREMHQEDEWNDSEEKDVEYSKTDGTGNIKAEEDKSKSGPRVQFTPGVILKIQLEEPLESAKKFKTEVKSLPKSDAVAYVDARDVASVVHIRCETAEGARDLLKDLPWDDKKILEGEDEKDYWDKILKDRDEKITKKIRVKQRGRDKILRKAENLIGKHVRFEH